MEGREALGANAGLVAMPSDDGASIELVATLGFTARRAGGLAALPRSRCTRRSAMPCRTGMPIFLDEGELARRYPDMRTSTMPTASVPLQADGPVLGALGFRFDAGPPLHATPSARSRPRSPSTAHTRSSVPACTTPSDARARPWPCSRRSASTSRARSSRTRRCARSPSSPCPAIADQCVVDLVRGDRIERRALVHADPALQEAARIARAVRARHRERHAGRGRDPPRRDAARARHAGSAGQRLPQRGPPGGGAQHRAPLDADGAADRARPHARRADVRLEARARLLDRRTSSSPSSSRAASRSRSTTARSTRRCTANASA